MTPRWTNSRWPADHPALPGGATAAGCGISGQFECKLDRIIDFGTEPPSSSLVIGEIVCVHLEESVVKEGRLDPDSLDLIGRMGGTQYSRTTQRFDMKRPELQRP